MASKRTPEEPYALDLPILVKGGLKPGINREAESELVRFRQSVPAQRENELFRDTVCVGVGGTPLQFTLNSLERNHRMAIRHRLSSWFSKSTGVCYIFILYQL